MTEIIAVLLAEYHKMSYYRAKKYALIRRFFTFGMETASIVLLIYLEVSISNSLIKRLATKNCSRDPVMHATFYEMANF